MSPAIWNGGNEKKNQTCLACQVQTSVRRGLISAVSNGGNEENDKRKNSKKWKWVILINNFYRGSNMNFFLALWSEKKNRGIVPIICIMTCKPWDKKIEEIFIRGITWRYHICHLPLILRGWSLFWCQLGPQPLFYHPSFPIVINHNHFI